MESPSPEKIIVLKGLAELRGKLVYTYKTHQKDSDLNVDKATNLGRADLIFTSLSFCSSLAEFIPHECIAVKIALKLATSLFIFFSLTIILLTKSSKYDELSRNHHLAAMDLKEIETKLVSTIREYRLNMIDDKQAHQSLSQYNIEYDQCCRNVLKTTTKGYELAKKAIKIDEESYFSNRELEFFLDSEVKTTDKLTPI